MYTRILILHTHCVQMCFTLSETHIGLCVMVCWYKHSIMGIIYRGSVSCCELNSWKSSGMVSGKEICVYETEMFCNIINVYVCVLTIAAVLQVWPDDVLLREAEHSQSSSSHCGINCHTRICHQLWSLIETNPKYTHRSMSWISQATACLASNFKSPEFRLAHLMYPTCGRCCRYQRYETLSFQPTFRGSFHRRRTWSLVSPVCQREFLKCSPGPVLDFTAYEHETKIALS